MNEYDYSDLEIQNESTASDAVENVLKKNKKSIVLKVSLISLAVIATVSIVLGAAFLGAYIANQDAKSDNDNTIIINDGEHNKGKENSNDKSEENPKDNIENINSATINKHDGGYDKITTSSSVVDVVSAVKDAVVEIQVTVVSDGFFGQSTNTGAGSGVIIAPEGYIVTNHHVIDGASTIEVRLTNGNEYKATLIGTDEGADIAVLKIEPKETLCVAELGSSSSLVLGEEVIAIGNPLGILGGTVTRGIISALERTVSMSSGNSMKLLQTDAAINPGNSGGGLFDLGGKLIGVVNAKYADESIEGLGFAIPIDYAYEIILDLIENGYVTGVIDPGLSLTEVNSSNYAYYYFNTRKTGVFVTESKYDANLKYGSLLVSINGKKIATLDDVSDALEGLKVGDKVKIEYEYQNKKGTTEFELREYVPDNIK